MIKQKVWFITGTSRGFGFEIAKALEKFGRVDVLVNNAGYGLLCAVEE